MKKPGKRPPDMRPEYDFSAMKGGVRGKYASRFQAGTNLVLLDPDVYAAFPTAAAVNEALRAVINISRTVHRVPQQRRKLTKPARAV